MGKPPGRFWSSPAGGASYPLPRDSGAGATRPGSELGDYRSKPEPYHPAGASPSFDPRVPGPAVGHGLLGESRLACQVPPHTENLADMVNAQVAAYHVPMEMVRRTPVPTGAWNNYSMPVTTMTSTWAHDVAGHLSDGGYGQYVSAPGGHFVEEQSRRGWGSPDWQGGLPRSSPAGPAAQSYAEQSSSRPLAFPGVVSPPLMGGDGARDRGSPPGLDLEQDLPVSELNLLIKFFNSLGDLPRIEVGEPHGRGERLTLWRVAVETQLKTTRRVVVDWWRWCNEVADRHYQRWLRTPVLQMGARGDHGRPTSKTGSYRHLVLPMF